jgi:hypothetical protein
MIVFYVCPIKAIVVGARVTVNPALFEGTPSMATGISEVS